MCGQACPDYPKQQVILITSPIYLKYVKKEVRDEVDFLHAYKDESFLQIDTMIFDGDG